jgi:hypothetical protein
LQVDNIPPLVSRSGRPIDLFPSGPISSIGHNAPTLASIVHRGVRLRKVTTRRTQTSPTVAAPTLARAFKAICQIFSFMLTIFISAIFMLINSCSLLQQTGASAKARCESTDAPQSSQPKRKGTTGAKTGTKRQKVATPPPPPVSPIPVESSPSSPEAQPQQAPSPPPMQEAPQIEEPQQEGSQTEDTSADTGEQTTGPVGPVIPSAVLPIQTTVVPPPGNIL